jgi:hypothetical protein
MTSIWTCSSPASRFDRCSQPDGRDSRITGAGVSALHGLNSYHFLKYSIKQVSTEITLLHNYKFSATVRILRVPGRIPWPHWLRHTVVHLGSSREVLGFNLTIDLNSIIPYLFHFITHSHPTIRPYNVCCWRRVVKYTSKTLKKYMTWKLPALVGLRKRETLICKSQGVSQDFLKTGKISPD